MFAGGPFIPIRQGSDRLIHDVAKYLHAQPDLELTLAIRGEACDGREYDYSQICRHVVWVKSPGRWSFWGWVNKVAARIGISTFQSVGLACGMRRQMCELARTADVVILNYLVWFPMLSEDIRRKKTICLTHDLLFYRRASLNGTDSLRKRWCVWLTKFFELRKLRTFFAVAVLGDYEEDLLRKENFPMDRVVRIGMPIEGKRVPCPASGKLYDFFMISGKHKVNIDGVRRFFEIVELLAPRRVCFALAGRICEDKELFENSPVNCELIKLGFIDDVDVICAQSRIGVAIVPRGAGIKVKTVELILRGMPIISTDHGVEGIPVTEQGTVNVDHEEDRLIKERVRAWLDSTVAADRDGLPQMERIARIFSPENALKSLCEMIQSFSDTE